MDTNNELNQTDNSQSSQNPQNTSAPGANDAADFQQTAPYNALNEEAENLSVQETGEPIQAGPPVAENNSFAWGWTVGILLVLGIVCYVLYALIKESREDNQEIVAAPAAKATKPKTTKVAAKKSTAKKKSNPNQRRKKQTKTKRRK